MRLVRRAGAAVVVWILPLATMGTTIENWDLSRMALASDAVVRGRVESVSVSRAPSGRLFTDAVVAVEEVLRGSSLETVMVTWPGGELEGNGQWVPGAPSLRPGEEVVLFLARSGPPSAVIRHHPLSLAAGVLHVHRTPEGDLLSRDLRGLHDPDGLPPPALPGRLEDLRRALRDLGAPP